MNEPALLQFVRLEPLGQNTVGNKCRICLAHDYGTYELAHAPWCAGVREQIIRHSAASVIVELTVEGQPVPKTRARSGNDRFYTPANVTAAEQRIQWLLQAQRVSPVQAEVACVFRFYSGDRRRVDLDNLEKLVMDACNKFVYDDDSQVVAKDSAIVRASPEPRTEILILRLPA